VPHGQHWFTLVQQLDRQLPKMLVEELNVLQVRPVFEFCFFEIKMKAPLSSKLIYVWQIIPTERHRLKLVNTLRR
jgi:hypothetical protein